MASQKYDGPYKSSLTFLFSFIQRGESKRGRLLVGCGAGMAPGLQQNVQQDVEGGKVGNQQALPMSEDQADQLGDDLTTCQPQTSINAARLATSPYLKTTFTSVPNHNTSVPLDYVTSWRHKKFEQGEYA